MAKHTTIDGMPMVLDYCPRCHVAQAFPLSLYDRAQEQRGAAGVAIHCPNGHSWYYTGKSDAEKAQEEAARQQRLREAAERQAQYQMHERVRLERRLAAAKGQQTKLKKRLASGVCPCCEERFDNVRDHLAEAHPEWSGAEVKEEA